MRRYSAGGRPSIAASISSTRLIFGVYHHEPEGGLRAAAGLTTGPTNR
jgi:hypothetical protein